MHNTRTADERWRSLHIFLQDTKSLEAFMLEQISPRLGVFQESGSAWFFIRYWEGGQHIRLRLRHPQSDAFDGLRQELSAAVGAYRTPYPINRASYMAALSPALGASALEEASSFYEDGTIVELPYAPELPRYGGPDAIGHSEMLFGVSSRMALAVMTATQVAAAIRLGVVRDLMVAGAAAWSREPDVLRDFFTRYARFWRTLAGNVPDDAALRRAADKSRAPLAARLRTIDDVGDVFGTWHGQMQKFVATHRELAATGRLHRIQIRDEPSPRSWETTIASIVSSHLHMTNNRLGTGPANEYALAAVIAGAL